MLFTTGNIDQLLQNIDYFHTLYIAKNVGVDVLSKDELKLLKKFGTDVSKYKDQIDFITYGYHFGKLESSLRDPNVLQKFSMAKYKEFIATNKEKLPIGRADKLAIHIVKQSTANDIRRLAGDIKSDFAELLVQTSKTQRLYIERMLKQRASGKQITQYLIDRMTPELSKKSLQYAKRFQLISGYNMHSAYQHGISQAVMEKYGHNVRVYFKVHKDACTHCKRVYLQYGAGSPARIFYLARVIAAGSNRGRKADQYRPSVDPLHPRCRCKMVIYLPKSKWDAKQMEYVRVFVA